MRKVVLFLMLAIVGIFLTIQINDALAYDPPNYDCAEGWGDNVTCLGMLTEDEINGADFQSALAGTTPYPAIWSPLDPNDLNVTTGGVDFNARFDNRRFPDGRIDSRIVLHGPKVNVRRIPQIHAIQVDDPGPDCSPDNNWHFNDINNCPNACLPDGTIDPFHPEAVNCMVYNGPYPVIIYHIDWQFTPECEQACNDQNWDWFPGDGTPCDICHENNPETDLPNAFAGTFYRSTGDDMLTTDIASIEWVEGGEQALTKYGTREQAFMMKYDMGMNFLNHTNTFDDKTIFMHGFSKQAEIGIHNFILHMADGTQVPFSKEVFSNLTMPTLSSFNDSLVFQKVKIRVKKGEEVIKIVDKERDITVVNLSAREIDGGRLLITFKPSDDVFTLPQQNNIRLRIFVGKDWFNEGKTGDGHYEPFLWIDVPLHTGNIVIPQPEYDMIKGLMPGNTIDIGGMYREEYDGYHNRGYFEGIKIEF